jgi:hypothetical protein
MMPCLACSSGVFPGIGMLGKWVGVIELIDVVLQWREGQQQPVYDTLYHEP